MIQTARQSCFTVVFKLPKTRNGLGNHLFYFAGVMYVAWLTGRTPFLLTSKKTTKLDKAFELDIARKVHYNRCAVQNFAHKYVYGYNTNVKDMTKVPANVSVCLAGSFCSWKYTQPIEDLLRRKLQFHKSLTNFVNNFLSRNVPRGWVAYAYVRVGVHVRRGDFLKRWAVSRGFTVASRQYFERAMSYFVDHYPRVQFVVASNDIMWCRRNIKLWSFQKETVNITFSVGHSTEQDLALLASCNHSIMSTGTFSWWAAWLAKGTTIYYRNFPKRRSYLQRRSNTSNFFLPTWIGMN